MKKRNCTFHEAKIRCCFFHDKAHLSLFYLFQLRLSVPVNNNGHVVTLVMSRFIGFAPKIKDVLTSKKCFKVYPPTKPIRLICMDGLT